MNYFNNISDLTQAKLRYRELAKKLHPDKGGSAAEFQRMQDEYQALLLKLQHKYEAETEDYQTAEHELMNELSMLAKELLGQQIAQNYLRKKMQTTDSLLYKSIFSGLIGILDGYADFITA